MRKQVAIIIPTLNAAKTLKNTLDCVAGASEIIVVDGGSADATLEIAAAAGARCLRAAPGRGGQLRLGVQAASAPYLLLLHADTTLSPDWDAVLPAGNAGYFRLRFDTPRRAARVVEAVAAWRARFLGLPYGDQGLLLSAELLAWAGGVPDLPLMEDVALVRRLGRRRLQRLGGTALTSAARYERAGYLRRSLRNLFCLTLYFAGMPPAAIKKLYG